MRLISILGKTNIHHSNDIGSSLWFDKKWQINIKRYVENSKSDIRKVSASCNTEKKLPAEFFSEFDLKSDLIHYLQCQRGMVSL